MFAEMVEKTIELVKTAQRDPVSKATFSQATGLVQYDLQRPALSLVPILSPIRNEMPRVMGDGGTATHWKAITAIDTTSVNPGVSEGNRGGLISVTVTDYVASYKGLGMEASTTFEAEYASEKFDDARARAVEKLLQAVMIAEEKVILDANSSTGLGTTPTPSLSASTTGGTLATATYNVYCVALSGDGFRRSSIAGGLPGQLTKTNTGPYSSSDTFGGGNAKISLTATQAVTGPTGSITATVAAVPGAAAYAWYWGVGAGASSLLGAITTVNKVVITATATGTQAANDAKVNTDFSQNALVYDGIIPTVVNGGGYFKSLNGAGFTGDSAAGIVEIDAMLKAQWDAYRVTPDEFWISSQEALNLKAKVLSAAGSPLIRFTFDAGVGERVLTAGGKVGVYFDFITGKLIPFRVHPYLTAGTMLGLVKNLPADVYVGSGVGNVRQIKTRRDYYQIEWPMITRAYEHGVYYDGLLQHYFPAVDAVIANIGNA